MQSATLGDLSTAIEASAFAIPVARQRIIRFKSDGSVVKLGDPSKQLVRDFNMWTGEDVVVEVTAYFE